MNIVVKEGDKCPKCANPSNLTKSDDRWLICTSCFSKFYVISGTSGKFYESRNDSGKRIVEG